MEINQELIAEIDELVYKLSPFQEPSQMSILHFLNMWNNNEAKITYIDTVILNIKNENALYPSEEIGIIKYNLVNKLNLLKLEYKNIE